MAERCSECGYDYDTLAQQKIGAAVRADAGALRTRLERRSDVALRARPQPGVWSPLEYACHVRDVLEVQRERVLLAQMEDEPEFVPMGREERAVDLRYNEQDPTSVGEQLHAAAAALARTFEALDASGWARAGIYTYPTVQLRTVEWIGRHTVHELRHHIRDVDTLLAEVST